MEQNRVAYPNQHPELHENQYLPEEIRKHSIKYAGELQTGTENSEVNRII